MVRPPSRLTGLAVANFAVTLPLLLAFCTRSGTDAAWEGTVRDSSGVTIVENVGRGRWGDSLPWTLSEELTIGTADGDTSTTFGTIADVRMNGRGEILVLDRQAASVGVFDASGSPLRSFGRPGEGPGELSNFTYSLLILDGDSVVVPDRGRARLTIFGPRGEILDPVSLEGSVTSMKWGALGPDRLVFRSLQNTRLDDGTIRSWDGIMTADRTGAIRDTLLVIPGDANPRGPPGQYVAPLLVVGPVWAVLDGEQVALARTDSEEIEVVSPSGALRRIIRFTGWERRPVGAAEASRMRDLFLTRYTDRGMDRATADGRFPSQLGMDAFPAFTQILGGPEGTLWVRRAGTLDEIDPLYLNAAFFDRLGSNTWDVFDAEGRLLGAIEAPDDVDLMSFSGDRLLGVHFDELGVQRVKVFRVEAR